MHRRSFIIRSAVALAAATATAPSLARAASPTRGAVVVRVVRHGWWGAVPGGCRDHRRRSMHAGYTRRDALERLAR